ncbi:hypothetical protein [Dokdonella immobilis]|uniref:Uncharacterized protein n=1 Tax=Dokdonella immobilis TaxID=578942 RepID=A0A1I5AXS8_9GAMM|nr:hypothetical protein [Dokdonella immobilis]SFN67222.1 hypothetical protein SAMN05216289_14517 [Dokdonella immobilis]
MNSAELIYYVCLVAPLAWLAFLALRPFLANMNRLLFIVVGMTLYGFFVKAFVVPLTRVQDAQLVAAKNMATMIGSPTSDASTQLGLGIFVYLGIALTVTCLLMLWIQRVLTRSPDATSRKTSSADMNPGGHGRTDGYSPSNGNAGG